MLNGIKIGPFEFCTYETTLRFQTPEGKRTFRVCIYKAYNAFGLIGTEKSGIAVLDEDNKCVCTDEICKAPSGYDQPTRTAIEYWDQIIRMDWEEFQNMVNNSPRRRVEI